MWKLLLVKGAAAWWDAVHQLIALVAEELLTKSEKNTVYKLLKAENSGHPELAESWSTNAIWADKIKCMNDSKACDKLSYHEGFELLNIFHFVPLTNNELGRELDPITDGLVYFNPIPNIHAVDALYELTSSLFKLPPYAPRLVFQGGKLCGATDIPNSIEEKHLKRLERFVGTTGCGVWTKEYNFRNRHLKVTQTDINVTPNPAFLATSLRLLFHIIGDIHQPMHCCNTSSSMFPFGDHGGMRVRTTKSINGADNVPLHMWLDTVLGQFSDPWPIATDENLRDTAKKLMKEHKDVIQMDDDNESDCFKSDHYPIYWEYALESLELCKTKIYPEVMRQMGSYTEGFEEFFLFNPTEEWTRSVNNLLEKRIVQGGARLASILKTFVQVWNGSNQFDHTNEHLVVVTK